MLRDREEPDDEFEVGGDEKFEVEDKALSDADYFDAKFKSLRGDGDGEERMEKTGLSKTASWIIMAACGFVGLLIGWITWDGEMTFLIPSGRKHHMTGGWGTMCAGVGVFVGFVVTRLLGGTSYDDVHDD